MDSDEVLTVQQCAEVTKQSEGRIRRALLAGVLPGTPSSKGRPGAIVRSDAMQWVRDGAPDGS